MNTDSPLARLADACGIESGYHDIWGTWHALSEDTARHLIGAMGIAATDDTAIEAALREQHAMRWAEMLSPVCVCHANNTVSLALTLAESDEDAVVHWRLCAEDGTTHNGHVALRDLEITDRIDIDAQQRLRLRLELGLTLPIGYHRLVVTTAQHTAHATIIVAPTRCQELPSPGGNGRGRAWGISLQLYGLRSSSNWGIGDLGDLANAATIFGALGADLIGINPLHALSCDMPDQASPYSPSSRCFANPLYLDVTAIPDFTECAAARTRAAAPDFVAELTRLRRAEFVDYAGVAALKWPMFNELYAHFRATHLSRESEPAAAFRRFQCAGGRALRLYAVFEVLHATADKADWADDLLDPDSEAVSDFAAARTIDIEFREYLQWRLAEQIDRVAACARASGMRIGLYRDLAVGSDAFGADVWVKPRTFVHNVSIGAPPDDFNLNGQVWGLPPWLPRHLEETAYADFVATLRANMRASGALRIDHVIGLMRLFWVPAGGSAADGAFVRYPLHDLLAILALESVRARCVIIGEDLGTVPDELRAALYDAGVLSYRVLYFSKHWHGDHSFVAPHEFPSQALVTVSTHDLPTFAGYWRGRDLELREALNLFPDDETRDRLGAERELDRVRLLAALDSCGLLPPATEAKAVQPSRELIKAVHCYAARSASALMMVQMEDVLGQIEQANVPGTVHEQPNWRRRLDLPLEQWAEYPPLLELAACLNTARAE